MDTIKLINFRSYGDHTESFSNGLNLVLGENGVGKTNLLEAVFFVLEGRSLKGAETHEMIRNGSDWGVIECKTTGTTEEEGKVVLWRGEETRRKGIKNIRAVAFVPDDIFLVKGSPELRRRFVDEIVKGVKPTYGQLMKEYSRVLKQRNNALRMAKKEGWETPFTDSWDLLLVRRGMEIVSERRVALHLLRNALCEVFDEWGMGEVEIKYYSSFSTVSEEENLKKLKRLREAEIRRGITLSGPHRDEIIFHLNGKNIRREGSHGEQKMLCMACKLAQARILEDFTAKKVVLILDDCFSELDSRNRERLAKSLKGREQAIVTSTERIKELEADRVIELTRRGKGVKDWGDGPATGKSDSGFKKGIEW